MKRLTLISIIFCTLFVSSCAGENSKFPEEPKDVAAWRLQKTNLQCSIADFDRAKICASYGTVPYANEWVYAGNYDGVYVYNANWRKDAMSGKDYVDNVERKGRHYVQGTTLQLIANFDPGMIENTYDVEVARFKYDCSFPDKIVSYAVKDGWERVGEIKANDPDDKLLYKEARILCNDTK